MSTCSDIQALRAQLLSDGAAGALAETFKVLGDATRVRILNAISRSELCVSDIAEVLGLSESAVSHQLRLLRGMRLVRPRRAGQQIFYTLDDHHIVGLFAQGLEHVQERVAAESGKPFGGQALDVRPSGGSREGTGRGGERVQERVAAKSGQALDVRPSGGSREGTGRGGERVQERVTAESGQAREVRPSGGSRGGTGRGGGAPRQSK